MVGNGWRPGVIAMVLFSAVLVAQAQKADWEIVLGQRVGAITTNCSFSDLVAAYGADEVQEEQIGIGEGETRPGVVVFQGRPDRTVQIVWEDAENRARPAFVRIFGPKSVWKLPNGLRPGSTLKEVEKLNGKAFLFSGFDWDYAGNVVSWEDGDLQQLSGKVEITFERPTKSPGGEETALQLSGEGPFRSDLPAAQRMNPVVMQMTVLLGAE